jgi:hypothetical protein
MVTRARLWSAAVPAIPLIALLFSLDRAVMIDDPLFLKAAAQIRTDVLRPFDFAVNWYGGEEAFWHVFKNPPGLSYWFAATTAVLGDHERVLHAAQLPFTIAAVVGAARIAQRFTSAWPGVTMVWAAAPAFLVSAATLMADVPSLAFSLWGLVLWMRGADDDVRAPRRAGATLAGIAVVVKYTAVLGVVTLALYALIATPRNRRGRHLADLWPACLAPAAWSLLTLATHGRNHIIDALTVGGGGLDPNPGWVAHRTIALLTFIAGTGVFPLLLAVPGLRHRRALLLGAIAVATGVGAAVGAPRVWSPRGLGAGALVLVGVLAAAGALALLVAFVHAAREADGPSLFLAAWIALHLVYLWLWSWTIAARFVLPLMLPLVILLAAAAHAAMGEHVMRRLALHGATATAALGVSVVLLAADGDVGAFYRHALPQVAAQARLEARRAHFVGSWGFQHYAERARLTKVNGDAPNVARGDVVVQPYYAANRELPAGLSWRVAELASLPGPAPTLSIHTMNINVGAGFYSSAYGPLPFARAGWPVEGVLVWGVTQ